MGIQFVTPETISLPLADGDSITIKKRLSHGERDAMFKLGRESGTLRGAELVAYLVAWSSPTPYALSMTEQERLDTINGLDPDSFDEIQDALKAHLDAQAEEKKLRTGGTASSPISPSVVAITGPMTTSGVSPQMSTT
jgi:hypothetical protein